MAGSRYALSVGCALLLSTGLVARPAPSARAAATIGFEVPAVVDPIHTNGEPDIDIDPQAQADDVPLEIDGVCCYNVRE